MCPASCGFLVALSSISSLDVGWLIAGSGSDKVDPRLAQDAFYVLVVLVADVEVEAKISCIGDYRAAVLKILIDIGGMKKIEEGNRDGKGAAALIGDTGAGLEGRDRRRPPLT